MKSIQCSLPSDSDDSDPDYAQFVSDMSKPTPLVKRFTKSTRNRPTQFTSDDEKENDASSSAMDELPPSEWVIGEFTKVVYEGAAFLGVIRKVVCNEAVVQCLKMPFGVDVEYDDLEPEEDSVFYNKLYKCDKQCEWVMVGRKWRVKFT